jgi:hypothetical protein
VIAMIAVSSVILRRCGYEHRLGDGSLRALQHGSWVPQYTITREITESNDFPSHQYQFSHTLPTKDEADGFAVQKAQEWIDKNQKP